MANQYVPGVTRTVVTMEARIYLVERVNHLCRQCTDSTPCPEPGGDLADHPEIVTAVNALAQTIVDHTPTLTQET